MNVDYTKIPLVFNVYKPVGPSSFSIVHHFKKNLGYDFGKIGHFGTLDPFAEGVLLIGVQGAQKLNDYVHQLLPKTYRAVGIFGGKTESGDLTSAVSETKDIDPKWQEAKRLEIEELLTSHFVGEYWQSPHAVSATKFAGKPLYRHALEGRIIQKEKVKREISDFKILDYCYPAIEFVVTVSSGTYVRSLFEEMAHLLGGVGALKVLERQGVGENLSKEAMRETDWPKAQEPFDLKKWGRPLDQVLKLNGVSLTRQQAKKYLQGQRLPIEEVARASLASEEKVAAVDLYWVRGEEEVLFGLARIENGELQAIFNLTQSVALFS